MVGVEPRRFLRSAVISNPRRYATVFTHVGRNMSEYDSIFHISHILSYLYTWRGKRGDILLENTLSIN